MQNFSWLLLELLKSHKANEPSLEPDTMRSFGQQETPTYENQKYWFPFFMEEKNKGISPSKSSGQGAGEGDLPLLVGWEQRDFTLPVCPIKAPRHFFTFTSQTFICTVAN